MSKEGFPAIGSQTGDGNTARSSFWRVHKAIGNIDEVLLHPIGWKQLLCKWETGLRANMSRPSYPEARESEVENTPPDSCSITLIASHSVQAKEIEMVHLTYAFTSRLDRSTEGLRLTSYLLPRMSLKIYPLSSSLTDHEIQSHFYCSQTPSQVNFALQETPVCK